VDEEDMEKVSKEQLLEIYGREKNMDWTEFLEFVRKYPSPKDVLKENICGEVIDLSDYEHFQLTDASPFDLKTLTEYNTAHLIKEALAYSPRKKLRDYGWLAYLPLIIIGGAIGYMILKSVI